MSNRKKIQFAAAALSAATLMVPAFGVNAFAQTSQTTVNSTDQQAANPALINPTADVNLQIHKYLGNPTGQTADGTILTPTSGTALQGVNFDVYKVEGVDLTTNKGWTDAAALYNYTITATDIANGYVTVNGTQYNLTKVTTVTTDATGTANFTQANGVGLYLVNENLATSTNVTAGGTAVDPKTITPAKPFFVTLPMTQPNDLNTWMYDVAVYPKNQSDSITKEVLDGNAGTANQDAYTAGQNLTYKLSSTISVGDSNGDKVVNGADLGYYWVGDVLPKEVTYVSSSLSIVAADGTVIPLAADTDYKVTTTSNADGTTRVEFSMTSAGLDQLAKYNGGKVVTDVVATVNEGASVNEGDIVNTGMFIPSAGWLEGKGQMPPNPGENPPTDTPDIPSNEVVSKYGDLNITKVDGGSPTTVLEGAVFSVYRDANFDGTCSMDEVSGTGFVTGATTDATGKVTIPDLQASNWYNGAAQTLNHGYCLVETKAPTGYNLNAQPIYFTIDYTTGTTTTAPFAALTVNNEKSNLNNSLPLTGGQGVAGLSMLGLALIGGGFAYYTASSKKRTTK